MVKFTGRGGADRKPQTTNNNARRDVGNGDTVRSRTGASPFGSTPAERARGGARGHEGGTQRPSGRH